MNQINPKVVDAVLAKLTLSEELRSQFLNSPLTIIGEIVGTDVNQETLQAIGEGFRQRFGDELSEKDLEEVAGGFFVSQLSALKPKIGRVGDTSLAISSYLA